VKALSWKRRGSALHEALSIQGFEEVDERVDVATRQVKRTNPGVEVWIPDAASLVEQDDLSQGRRIGNRRTGLAASRAGATRAGRASAPTMASVANTAIAKRACTRAKEGPAE
jgi:hypothetical protein